MKKSFGEQYGDSMQDSGFNSPEVLNPLLEDNIGTLMSGSHGFTFDSYARMNFSAQPAGIWPLSIWKRLKIDVLLMYTKASQHPCAPLSSWQVCIAAVLYLVSICYNVVMFASQSNGSNVCQINKLKEFLVTCPTSTNKNFRISRSLNFTI